NTPDMITGTLKIYKWSECDCLLDGAVFGLFDSLDASEPLFTATTINGVAVFENLPEGTYYYQELAAPAGYILNTNRKMIVIDEKDEVVEVNVINYKYEYGDLIVHKVDLYHGVIPLHGATFALYNAQDERVDEETTDYNGLLRFENLPYGTYKLVEVVAPHGYVLDATPRMVTIDQDEVSIVIKNRMQETTSGLFIFKVDLHEGKPMPLMGATFTLYDFTGRKVIASNLTTNLLGFVNVPNLPSGHYWIQETKAPEGYELMNVKLPVYVSIHSPYSFIVVPNIRTSAVVELHKYDANTNAPLANVVFDVYKANDRERVVATMTTDLSGYAKSGKLPWGDYVLVERSTPAGYQALEPIDFTIGKTDSKVSLEVYNEQIRGSVSLYKYDAITQEAIAGAIFTLQGEDDMYYSLDGAPLSEPVMLTSDEMGEIRVTNLLAGTYRFVEVANEGYEVDATPQVVELAFPLEMNTVVAVNGGEGFANTPEKARVVIHNVNEQDLPINGGKFQIWTSVNGAPGELIEEVETLVEGTKESMWLPYGDYFYLQVRTPQGYILSNPAPVPFTLSLETVDDARELHVYVVNRAQRTYLLSDLKFANVFEIQDRFPDAFQNTSFSIYTSEDISYVNEEGPQFVAKGTKYTFNLKQSGEQTFVLDYGNFTRYMYPGFYYMVQEEVDINYQKFNEVYPFEVVEGIDVIWGNTNARSEETDGTLLLYHKVKRFDINVFYMMEGGGRALPSGRFALLDSNEQPIDELFTGYYDPENFFEDIKALFVFNATQKARMLVTSNKSMEWTALTLGNNANALKDASLFDQEVGPLGVEKSAQDFAAVSIAQEDPAANPLILATDANGELIFPDLPNGTYYVQKVGSPTLYKAVIFNQDVDITVYEREGGDDDVPTFANDYLDLFMATGVLSLLGILVLGRRRKEREEE
ncbi:MAG: SpaA isopeptide-forming pilin-related protein, partial [Erysipelotrichaceae bacterium]